MLLTFEQKKTILLALETSIAVFEEELKTITSNMMIMYLSKEIATMKKVRDEIGGVTNE